MLLNLISKFKIAIFAHYFKQIMIQLHDKQFVPFISAKEIEFALHKNGCPNRDDFADEIPVFVGG
jgi:hypothetical protein